MAIGTHIGLFGTCLYLGRAPRTKETLPDFLESSRVTRHSRVFRGLTGCQRTPGFWGVTMCGLTYPLQSSNCSSSSLFLSHEKRNRKQTKVLSKKFYLLRSSNIALHENYNVVFHINFKVIGGLLGH